MRWLFAALLSSLILLPAFATDSFAQNQQGKGSQATGSASGITGVQGNQGGGAGQSTAKGNAGGTR